MLDKARKVIFTYDKGKRYFLKFLINITVNNTTKNI